MTPLEIGLIVGTVGALLGLVLKIIFDERNRKLDTGKSPVMMCPLDRHGTITSIDDIKAKNLLVLDKLNKLQSDLDIGVDVAKRNTRHYEKFNDLILVMSENFKKIAENIKELKEINQRQEQTLQKIAKNGNH
jgi:hypothetical protein